MRNVKIDSTTDSPLDQRVAGMQPYNSVSLTVITAGPSVKREDGSIEHGEDDIQNLSALVPGRELRQNMLEYSKRVEDFRAQYPDFDRYVGQDVPIPLSVRDEIFRQENGPDIALFLGFCPDIAEQLCRMHPLDAAKCIESISEDLQQAAVPGDGTDYAPWKAARNSVKKAPARKQKP
jgi:hypothetical protein